MSNPQFAHFGNPYLGITAVGSDLGTRADPFFTASKVTTALQNGIDVLVHPQSCLRFGTGNGTRGLGDALLRMTGVVPANGAKLGVYDDDLFTARPMYDGLIFDTVVGGSAWAYIGGNNWQRTLTSVNMVGAKAWANAFCGKSKDDVVMLRAMPSAAACAAERDCFFASGAGSLLTINTGSATLSPTARWGDIAYSPSTQYGIANLDFVACKNLRFEYSDLTGGYMGVWANQDSTVNPGFTSRDMNFVGLRHYCEQQGNYWVISSSNQTGAPGPGICDVTSFVLDVTFNGCETHSKFDVAATYNNDPGFSTGYGTHNGLQVQGNCGNIDYVDCPIYDGFRHCGTQFLIGQYNSVDGTWPRGIKFRGSDPKNRVQVENVPTCYGHPIGSFLNGGITFENIDVHYNSNQSEFGGVGMVRNVRWLDNVAPVGEYIAAQKGAGDICMWIGDLVAGTYPAPHMACLVKKLIVEDCLFDRPTNYAVVVMVTTTSGGVAGGVEFRHNTIIDFDTSKLWPNTGSGSVIVYGTAGPNVGVLLCDGGQGSSTQAQWQIIEDNVVVGGPSMVAAKMTGGNTLVNVYTPNDPTYGGSNPLVGNATYASLVAAGMDATGKLLYKGDTGTDAAVRTTDSPMLHTGSHRLYTRDGNGKMFDNPPSIGAYEGISDAPFFLPSMALPVGDSVAAYSYQVIAPGAHDFQLTPDSGVLPQGFSLSKYGLISGTSSETGSHTFKLRAINRSGLFTDSALLDIPINGPGVKLDANFAVDLALPVGSTFTRASNGAYCDIAGVLRFATANLPRFTYSPVAHASLGLMVEPAATNLGFPSQGMTTGNWSNFRAPGTPGMTTSPDGAANGTGWVADATTNTHGVQGPTPATTAGQVYTISVWAKKGLTQFLGFVKTSGSIGACFDLNGGTISTQAGLVGAGIEAWPNGWYRCWITITATGTSERQTFYGQTVSSISGPNYAGDAVNASFYLYGYQAELGSVPSSHIITTTGGGAATRAADACTLPSSSVIGYVAASGSLVVDAYSDGVTAGAAFSLGDGSANNVIALGFQAAAAGVQCQAVSGAASQGNLNVTGPKHSKFGVAYQAGASGRHLCANGGAVSTATWAAMTGPNVFNFGGAVGGASFVGLNGTIVRARYYNNVLSDAALQAATT